MKKLMRFFKDEEGATAVEYAIMAGAIAALVVVTAYYLGYEVNDKFSQAESRIANPPQNLSG